MRDSRAHETGNDSVSIETVWTNFKLRNGYISAEFMLVMKLNVSEEISSVDQNHKTTASFQTRCFPRVYRQTRLILKTVQPTVFLQPISQSV